MGIDEVEIAAVPIKATPYIPGLTEGNDLVFSPSRNQTPAIRKARVES